MFEASILEYRETRRANRMKWSRPVKIIAPHHLRGRSVNVSATGILIRLPMKAAAECPQVGEEVKLAIPNLDNSSMLEVSGQVVRVEFARDSLRFALDLTRQAA